MKETIVVERNGKFGPSVGGVWYSFGKFFKGEKQLTLNTPIDVDVFVSDSGKKYINSVLGAGVPTAEAPKAVVPAPKKATPKAESTTMSKEEWQAKDVRISRQGCIQVAVQVTGNFEEAIVLADKMLGYVNEK